MLLSCKYIENAYIWLRKYTRQIRFKSKKSASRLMTWPLFKKWCSKNCDMCCPEQNELTKFLSSFHSWRKESRITTFFCQKHTKKPMASNCRNLYFYDFCLKPFLCLIFHFVLLPITLACWVTQKIFFPQPKILLPKPCAEFIFMRAGPFGELPMLLAVCANVCINRRRWLCCLHSWARAQPGAELAEKVDWAAALIAIAGVIIRTFPLGACS